MSELRGDATLECDACGMPLIPMDKVDRSIVLECANRHTALVPTPTDRATLQLVDNWLARRGAQIHEQRERWAEEERT